MKFTCDACGFKTDKKSNYNTHLNTARHKRNANTSNPTNIEKKIDCVYCDSKFTSISNLNRHLKLCVVKQVAELKKLLETKDDVLNKTKYKMDTLEEQLSEATKTINDQRDMIDKLKDKYTEDIIQLKDQHMDTIKEVTDQHIETLKDESKFKDKLCETAGNITTKAMTNMQYLMHHYKDAPNLTFPDKEHLPLTDEDYEKSFSLGPIDGTVWLMKRLFIDNVDPENRATWCLDYSRVRYATRIENEWHHDEKGREVMRVCIYDIQDLMGQYFNSDKHQQLASGYLHDEILHRNLERATHLKKLSELETQHKIMRAASNEFMLCRDENNQIIFRQKEKKMLENKEDNIKEIDESKGTFQTLEDQKDDAKRKKDQRKKERIKEKALAREQEQKIKKDNEPIKPFTDDEVEECEKLLQMQASQRNRYLASKSGLRKRLREYKEVNRSSN